MDTTELNDDLPETMVSLIELRWKMINDGHEGNYDLLCTHQLCDETEEMVGSALSQVGPIDHTTTTHNRIEETPTLEGFLQARLQIVDAQPQPRQLDLPLPKSRTSAMVFLYDRHQ